jgi:outer membrane protein assembly factor BamB
MFGALGRTQRRQRSQGLMAASLAASAALALATLTLPAATQAYGGVAAAQRIAYAYVGGRAHSPSSCPRTASAAHQCTLTEALARVRAGGAVLLASGGAKSTYYGNFTIGTSHTSARAAVTLRPVPGVRHVVINGDGSGKVPCPTQSCDGAVLTVASHVFVHVQSVTIADGNNTTVLGGGGVADLGDVTLTGVTITNCKAQLGGAASVGNGASLTVSHSAFSDDSSLYFGGAIDVGSVVGTVKGSGRLTVTGSVFTNDHSPRGGAIDSGDVGTGTLTVTGSTFSRDTASVHGGAIDSGDGGKGTLSVTDSTFSRDTSAYGGAIDNADSDGSGTVTVQRSTFSQDSAVHGGAIDNAERGNGTVSVATSTFYADRAKQGAALDSGDAAGKGSVVILNSTIDGNLGAAALARQSGSLQLAGSILAGTSARCASPITDLGYNLASSTTSGCAFSLTNNDLLGVNPQLGSLRRNGGPTATIEPSRSSPALEQIPNPAVVALRPSGKKASLCPVPDQRGVRFTEAVGCTIGSVDPITAVPVVTALGSSIGPAAGGGTTTIRGGNFRPKATVRFGNVRATHVTVVSSTRINATVPALPDSDSGRTVAVTVTNPSGRNSPYRATAIYTYYTSDWSSYLGGASHSSFNPAAKSISTSSIANLQPIWQWQPPASPNSGQPDDDASPIVSHGVVYVGLEDGEMYALSEATQQILWSQFLGVELPNTCQGNTMGIISTATVADDPVTGKQTVYVNGPDGYLYALDAATGAIVWKSVVGIPSKTIDNYYAWGSPTVANGKVYIGIASNCDVPLVRAGVLVFNQHSGKRLAYWDSLPQGDVGASVWSSVAVLPDGNVVATTGNAQADLPIPHQESINLLNGSTLKLLGSWMAPQSQAAGDSDFGASPTVFTAYPSGVATTMIGACNKNGIYYALRANDISAGPLWEHRMGVPTSGALPNECDAAAIWNGKYLIEGGGSAVTIRGQSYNGSVQALNPTTGKPVWQTGLGGWIVGSPSEDGAGVVAAPVFSSPAGITGVYLLSASTGKILTFISTEPMGVFAQPVFDGNDLLIGDEFALGSLTAYAVTTPGPSALGVSPTGLGPGLATLTLTGTGFTPGAKVFISGAQVVVKSVDIDNSTTATVQIQVLADAEAGTSLNVTLVEPDLTAYSCTSCLALS